MVNRRLDVNRIGILEMPDYLHCWHDCGPGRSYATLSKDLSTPETTDAVRRILEHFRECTGLQFPLVGDTDG